MVRPAPSFRELLSAFHRERWDTVADRAELVAAKLLEDPLQAPLAPAAVLVGGWARAEEGYLPVAVDLLERGLSHLSDPGAERELGGLDAFYLRLVELYLLTGDQPAALAHLSAMSGPDAPLSVRFPAQRFVAAVAAARGDDQRAAALLDTAEQLADQTAGKRDKDLVVGDRAIWLALTHQPGAAAALAEPVWAGPLPRRSPRAWLGTQGVAVAVAVATAAADARDTSLADTWLAHGEQAATHLSWGPALRAEAHLALARSARAFAERDLETAEERARVALRAFHRMGMRPAAAAAKLRLARVSIERGFDLSSDAARRSLVRELQELGQERMAQECGQLAHLAPV